MGKVVKITGKQEEDFKRVVAFLEEQNILSDTCLIRTRHFGEGAIVQKEYRKIVAGNEVLAIFETRVSSGHTTLNNAWVQTK